MFETAYESAWHSPLSLWLAGAIFLGVLARHGGELRDVLALLTAAIALDAALSGALSPLQGAPAAARTATSFAFVVLGDLRYFYLVERFGASQGKARAAVIALAFSFVVPIAVLPLRHAAVAERVLYLGYEIGFFVVALVMMLVVVPRRAAGRPPEVRRWLRELTAFELVQYGLWAGADLLVLAGWDLGYGVRLVPNTLYYAAFLPFAWARAPQALRAAAPAR